MQYLQLWLILDHQTALGSPVFPHRTSKSSARVTLRCRKELKVGRNVVLRFTCTARGAELKMTSMSSNVTTQDRAIHFTHKACTSVSPFARSCGVKKREDNSETVICLCRVGVGLCHKIWFCASQIFRHYMVRLVVYSVSFQMEC